MVKDAASLREGPVELRATAANLIELVKSQALQIEKLKHELAGHRRHRFGARSETLEQLEFALEEAEIGVASSENVAPTGETSRPKQTPKRKPLPDSLPRNEQVLSPGDACGQCGGALKRVGEDVTKELDYIPGVRRHASAHCREPACARLRADRCVFGVAERDTRAWPAHVARRSFKLHSHRAPWSAVVPVRVCSPTFWSRSMATICPSLIGRVWSMAVTVQRAGPYVCPWSARRHKMRTLEVGMLQFSTSASLQPWANPS